MKVLEWKYKVGGSFHGLIPSVFLLVLFGGLALWLYISKNTAVWFALMLTLLAVAVLLVVIYRALFVKVLIGKNGILYQTRPGNQTFFTYQNIEKAWVSSGKTLNGMENSFCSFQTVDGQVIRFCFYPYESKSVDFFIDHVNQNVTDQNLAAFYESRRKYRIDGKVYGKTSIVITGVLLGLFLFFDITIRKIDDSISVQNFGSVLILGVLIFLCIRYFYFRVEIGTDGFYIRTNPFNGKYYSYHEIKSCKEELKIYRHFSMERNRHQLYYYYFIFTDQTGKSRKFLFSKNIYEHEIKILKERIEKAV